MNNLIPQAAIEKSIEGGWKSHLLAGTNDISSQYHFQVICDPTFWQALGKAKGWDEYINEPIEKPFLLWIKCNLKQITPEEFKSKMHVSFGTFYDAHKRECIKANKIYIGRKKSEKRQIWKGHAIRFCDLVLNGSDVTSFWADLLK